MHMRSATVGVVCVAAVAIAASCARLESETFPGEEAPALPAPAHVPPKKMHLSVKLVLVPVEDTAKVSAKYLPNWQPKTTPALGLLGTFASTELTAFFDFVRIKTRTSITQVPQFNVFGSEEATFNLEEGLHSLWLLVQVSGPGQAEPAQMPAFKLSLAPRLIVIPHVSGTNDEVILSLAGAAAELGADVDDDSTDTFERTQTNASSPVTEVRVRDRETAVFAGGLGEWRGRKVNVLVTVTPTVLTPEQSRDME